MSSFFGEAEIAGNIDENRAKVNNLEKLLRNAGHLVTFHRYPGTGHWFFEPDRTQAFNQAAASLAWERTLAFLNGLSNL